MQMTIYRSNWGSASVQLREVPDLAAAARDLGYPNVNTAEFFVRRPDGTWYADLTDYRYGDTAYVCKVSVEQIDEARS